MDKPQLKSSINSNPLSAPEGSITGKASVSLNYKLTGEDTYQLWVFKIKILLVHLGSWDSTTDKPMDTPTAFLAITSNCNEEISTLLLDCKSAPECWELFKTKWATPTSTSKIQALRSLTNFRFSDFTTLKSIRRTLNTVFGTDPINVTDLLGFITISCLPERFSASRTLLEKESETNKNNLKLEAIETIIISQQDILDINNSTHPQTALIGKQANRCCHGRPDQICWTCHPELKAVCHRCKRTGQTKFLL
jgi:hypothetical protein